LQAAAPKMRSSNSSRISHISFVNSALHPTPRTKI
jgi:hypothetical protein